MMPDIIYVYWLNSQVCFVDSTKARIFVGNPSITVSF